MEPHTSTTSSTIIYQVTCFSELIILGETLFFDCALKILCDTIVWIIILFSFGFSAITCIICPSLFIS